MHRGFKLGFTWEDEEQYANGLTEFLANKAVVEKTLKGFVGRDGILNGTQLQENWFPQIEVDIFISHSHKDQKSAISIASWLQRCFGLKVFIDSCIWEHADDLLWLIDKDYCYDERSNTFIYENRNQSTSHVHMMLSTALSMMIDKAECLFFLNTPNSIQTTEAIDKTKSPWIYNEIAISQIIRKKRLSEYRRRDTKVFSALGRMDEGLVADYEVHLAHLQSLTDADLRWWKESWFEARVQEERPLDRLYELFAVDKYLHG